MIVPIHTAFRRAAARLIFALCFLHAAVFVQAQELAISDDDFKRLDTFEGLVLAKADKVFAQKDYRRSSAEYEAFLLQFPKSTATAYALFRRARSLHLDGKRYEAIKAYNEVLDYFPNAVNYAAAALYQIGVCHWDNGDAKEAAKAWTEMANDVDYRKHSLAPNALNRLGDFLVQDGKPVQAVEYYKQVAVDFRRTARDLSWYALNKVVPYYVRTQPDEPKLREFYDKVSTFEWDPRTPDETNYWVRAREAIRTNGKFEESEKDAREKHYRYWIGVMEGKHLEWDDYQVDISDFKRILDSDTTRWIERLDQQFAKYQKPDNYGRIIKWIYLFREQKAKVKEYYAKLDFSKLSGDQVQWLMRILYENVGDNEMAKSVFNKIRLDAMNDTEKYNLERFLWNRDGTLVALVCQSMTDKEAGQMELLRYYHWSRNYALGMPLSDEMSKSPKYAKEAWWLRAEMLHWQNKLVEAIVAYQSADNPPQNLWRIADCYLGLGKRDQGVQQLREIESFFQDQASAAALRVAYVYRDASDKKQYVASLRGIMMKYPKSGESSTAHQELEGMGIKIGGGVDAE